MTNQVHRCMITPAAEVQTARNICATLAPSGGSAMFQVALSYDGSLPASHYVSTGHIDEPFANLMPLFSFSQDEQGVWQKEVVATGSASTVAALCQQEGLDLQAASVQDVFDKSDVTTEDPFVAFARLGLMLVDYKTEEVVEA